MGGNHRHMATPCVHEQRLAGFTGAVLSVRAVNMQRERSLLRAQLQSRTNLRLQ